MNKSRIERLSIKYNIDPKELETYIPLSNEYNLHLYDIKSLFYKYKKQKYVEDHIQERQFANKTAKWLDDEYKLFDTDRFRQAAIDYKNTKRYTDAVKNPHPNSNYMQFWTEEARRCIYGYYNKGDWITGYHYFYLNYATIDLVKALDEGKGSGSRQGDRINALPYFWDSDYFYFHYLEEAERNGKSAAVLKTRRRGYSWKGASMMNRNFFLIPRSRSIVYASSGEYLSGQDGILTKAWSQMIHLDKNTAWSKRRQKKDTETYKRASLIKKVNGVDVEDGFLSEIAGVTLKDDPDKARGKAAKVIFFEEAGSFSNITHSWIVSEPSVKQGNITFGLRVAFGTGGREGVGFDGLRKFFYNPGGYKIYSLPNLWTPGNSSKNVAWFQPEYMSREGFYDKDGNSNVHSAKENITKEREQLIEDNTDTDTFLRHKAEYPMVPEDAMLRTSGSPFPRAMIKEQIIRLESETYIGENYRGKLVMGSLGKLVWREDSEVTIIESHKATSRNRKGGIEVYEHPIDNVKEAYMGYIIGVDPVDYDYDEVGDKYSLGSCFVMNTFTKKIVAEYTGRPDLANEFYETVRRLAIYYDAKVMYENNIKGLHVYFVNNQSEYLLAAKPRILDDSDTLIKLGTKKYGYSANSRSNKFGLELLKKWLLEPLEEHEGMNRIHTIRSKGLLDELIEWNPSGNFDRISAMIALLIYYQDVERLLDESINDTNKQSEYAKLWTKGFVRKGNGILKNTLIYK